MSGTRSKTSLFNAEFIEKYIHLFLIDIDAYLISKDGLSKFETLEHGFSNAFLRAYIAAFSTPIFRKITNKFPRDIHTLSVSHMPDKTPGQFRTGAGAFDVRAMSTNPMRKLTNPGASVEGVKEFIDYWLINEEKPFHMLIFRPNQSQQNKLMYVMRPANNKKDKIYFCQMRGSAMVSQEVYSHEKHYPFIEKLLGNFFEYTLHIQTQLFESTSAETYQMKYKDRLQKLCDEYNKSILLASNREDKIRCIITYVQRCIQLHPFFDGNTRTGYIQLNRLLHEEGLSFSLMINPNRLDCFSIEELITIVKFGQDNFIKLCRGIIPDFTDESHKEAISRDSTGVFPDNVPVSKDLLAAFVNIVLMANYKKIHSPFLITHYDSDIQYKESDFKSIRRLPDC